MNLTNELTNVENIKVVIFDFDDTLYRGGTWTRWGDYVINFYNIAVKDPEKCQAFRERYGLDGWSNGATIAKAMIDEFGSARKFSKYGSKFIFQHIVENMIHVSDEEISKISKEYKLYIVSNNTKKYIKHYLGEFEISRKHFKGIYENKFLPKDPTKSHIYHEIMKKTKTKPQEILVVGDNYDNDVLPALNLGMNGAHVTTLDETREVIGFLTK